MVQEEMIVDLDGSLVPRSKYKEIKKPFPFYNPKSRLKYILVCRLGQFRLFRFLIGGTWQMFELGRGVRLEWRRMNRKLPMALLTEEYL